jgi:hypothetical protein
MTRTTTRQVDAKIDRLNKMLGVNTGAVGSYERGSAYGGHTLYQIINEYRGVRSVSMGHAPLAHLDSFVAGVIEGVATMKGRD